MPTLTLCKCYANAALTLSLQQRKKQGDPIYGNRPVLF